MPVEQKIVQHVASSLGFEVHAASVHASEKWVANEFMPFFNRTMEDQSTWKNEELAVSVQFNNLVNITQRKGRPRFPNIKSLSVTTNPHTQEIMKITSAWPENIPHIAPFPGAGEEEKQLIKKGEHFTTLPDKSPPINFYSALKILQLTGPVSPVNAHQVMAYLVVHATVRYTDRLVWIIQTRGIDLEAEGYAAQKRGIPVDARNHMRHIVDAVTGAWLFSDTSPQPV